MKTKRNETSTSNQWLWLYFVLAAFDLLTISFSLYLNHRLVAIYTESVRVNEEWASRQNRYSKLDQLAGAVNAPGNDVFDTHDADGESQRAETALAAFDQAFVEARDELAHLDPNESAPLLVSLAQVRRAMDNMHAEAESIFGSFRSHQPDQAGKRMAAMDRKYAGLHAALAGLNWDVREIQKARFTAQETAAVSLRRYELLIAGCITLMVVGVTLYGRKLTSAMLASNQEREGYLAELQKYRDHLQALVDEQTAELCASEARMRMILDAALDAVISMDAQGLVMDWNPEAERIFGYSHTEALGKLLYNLIIPPSACEACQRGIKHFLKTGEGPILGKRIEVTAMRAGGSEFPVEMAIVSIRHGDGCFFNAFLRDITEREQNELALIVAQHHLQTAFDTISRKNVLLEESNRVRSAFLAAMSHELKTPLNTIIGFSELLKEDIAGTLDEEQRDFLQDIYAAGHRLLGLLSAIIDFAGLESGYIRLELGPVDADAWLTESVMPWRERAAASGLTFELEIPKRLGILWLDAPKARQITANLLSNAVKFSPAGGRVTLTAHRVDQAQVVGNALPDAYRHYLEIVVRDTGIGFKPDILPKLFEPFHQGDATLARPYGGVGLGLAMLKRLVELHGGKVQAENEPEQGARITVWLPWKGDPQSDGITSLPRDVIPCC